MIKFLVTLSIFLSLSLNAKVLFLRVPDDGLSPQCVTDSNGVVHMIYFKGPIESGDIFYTTFDVDSRKFKTSLKVNSIPGTATLRGTTRHPQMAVGKDDTAHIVWNGADTANGQFLYSKSIGEGQFSPQRDMKGETTGIDGGGSVAANDNGQVFLVWHALPQKKTDEEDRQVFITVSKDNGNSFSTEKVISPKFIGASSGSSLKVAANGKEVMVLFRGVKRQKRDTYELLSRNNGLSFSNRIKTKEYLRYCPESSHAILPGKKDFIRVWEHKGLLNMVGDSGTNSVVDYPIKKIVQKHPFLAMNSKNQILVVWGNYTDIKKEGEMEWEMFELDGRKSLFSGRKVPNAIKSSCVVSAFSFGDDFVIVY